MTYLDRYEERRLFEIMRKQLGVATRQQAGRVGLTADRLRQLVRQGYVRRVATGVYANAGTKLDGRSVIMAATLAIKGSVASHHTALALHLDSDQPPQVDVLVTRRDSIEPFTLLGTQIVVHRTRYLPARERCRVGPVPATMPARTLLDLAAAATTRMRAPAATPEARPTRAGQAAPAAPAATPTTTAARADWLDEIVGELLASRRLQPEAVHKLLRDPRHRNVKGAPALREALERATVLEIAKTESYAERQFRRLITAHGVPPPVPQLEIRGARGGLIGRADFAWPAARLIVEVDGSRWHSSMRAQRRDRGRDVRARAAGWETLRFSALDVDEHAEDVLRELSAVLGLAEAGT